MLGMIISFILGILAGVIITSIIQVNTINEYEKIFDDMAEKLVGDSIWTEDKEIIIFNTKEQVKKYFMKEGE